MKIRSFLGITLTLFIILGTVSSCFKDGLGFYEPEKFSILTQDGGVILWLDASDRNADGTNETTTTLPAQWEDILGSTNYAEFDGVNVVTDAINGLAALRVTGRDTTNRDNLKTSIELPRDLYVYTVVKVSDPGAGWSAFLNVNQKVEEYKDSGGGVLFNFQNNSGPGANLFNGGIASGFRLNGTARAAGTPVPYAEFFIIGFGGQDLKAHKNSNKKIIYLGHLEQWGIHEFEIAEVIFWNRVPNSEEKREVEAFLAAKYAIALD